MLDEKTLHRRFERRRANRRYRLKYRTPREERARQLAKKQALEDDAVTFTRFFLQIGKWNRAREKTVRKARIERSMKRKASLRRPLTERRLELVKRPNGQIRQRQRRVVIHEWRPAKDSAPRRRLLRHRKATV